MRVTMKSHAYPLLFVSAILKILLHYSRVKPFIFFFMAFSSVTVLEAAVIVRPEQAVYYVMPGETFDLRIHIDANDSTLGNAFEPIPTGLFSFGVKATFPGVAATVPTVNQITPAAQLNFFGFSSGARKEVTANSARAKGNVDMGSGTPYSNSLLLTIQLTNLAPTSSSYLVNLDEWRTLGPSEQIFITGSGAVLDTSPSSNLFMPALIVVVPEPSTLCLLLCAVSAIGVRCRNRVAGISVCEGRS